MSSNLQQLLHRRSQLEQDLQHCERQIAELEEAYLDETPYGNIVKGFDGFVNAKMSKQLNSQSGRRQRVPIKDRLFSQSSVTAPIHQEDEHNQMADDQYHP